MSENQRITKYITQFARLATQVPWGPAALRYQFYKGLPARLKDRISEVGKPETLEELRTLAQSLDHRYWECKSKLSRESGSSKSTPKNSGNSGNTDSKANNSNKDQKSGHKSGQQTDKFSAQKDKAPEKRTPKPYADKLGKDGKLTQEERNRRFANNLCLFCSGAGHMATACPKKSSMAAKARAAKPKDKTPEAKKADTESKN